MTQSSMMNTSHVDGSSPRWHLPGRAHVPQPYENHINSGLSEFIQNRAGKPVHRVDAAGFGGKGGRRHFPVIQTPTQREPQLYTANNVDYYKRKEERHFQDTATAYTNQNSSSKA